MDWLATYSQALEERDDREHVYKDCIESYTKLADYAAAAWNIPIQVPNEETATDPATPKARSKGKATVESEPLTLTALRSDLASTQKARAALQSQLADLTTQLDNLSSQQRLSQQQLTILTKQKQDVDRKLRDRDEELRGKSKLVEQAHDEMAALGFQLSVAEVRSERLEKENKELVERWMRRMGEEAEKVNRDSKWE
ncbi:autophagy protein 16, interacts with Atg12p-Atg5p [Oleoguttula sp. CCFEE 5521]